MARGASIALLYPLDTMTTRSQMALSNRKTSPLRISVLYRGLLGSLVGQVPYGMLTFGSYEIYKHALLSSFPQVDSFVIFVGAAILGDLTGSLWLCPSEIVKQNVQSGVHPSVWAAVQAISASGLSGFYDGYIGQILRDVPFRAIQMPTFELIKHIYHQSGGYGLPTVHSTTSPSSSGVTSSSIVNSKVGASKHLRSHDTTTTTTTTRIRPLPYNTAHISSIVRTTPPAKDYTSNTHKDSSSDSSSSSSSDKNEDSGSSDKQHRRYRKFQLLLLLLFFVLLFLYLKTLQHL